MKKKNNAFKLIPTIFLAIFFSEIFAATVFGITPNEVFENGRRAFFLGNWLEAREQFSQFNESWPSHPLTPLSLYFKTLAEVRIDRGYDPMETRAKIASLTGVMKALSERLPEADLNELQTEADFLKTRIGETDASLSRALEISPEHLQHALKRGWVPFPADNPFKTLEWIRTWMELNKPYAATPVFGRLYLFKAKALMRFWLSPLPTLEFSSTLEKWGEWPLAEALSRSLNRAFDIGEPRIKREAALLGVTSDYLESQKQSKKRLRPKESQWVRFLKERGIHFKEAWCP